MRSAERINDWGDFVLERVRKGRRKEQVINLEELVSEVLLPFRNSFSYRSISPDVLIDKNIPAFSAFPIDFEAIIINLVSNAVKALEKTPRATRTLRLRATYHQSSNELEVRFEDSGRGIELNDLPRPDLELAQIFEPFISGRGLDGTGMGLAVVSRIVKFYKGKLSVEGHGQLGGALFTISLPLKLAGDGQ